MPNAWIFAALDRAPVLQGGGFLVPYTVLMENGQPAAAYNCLQASRKDPRSLVLRRLFECSQAALPGPLGLKDQRTEFLDKTHPKDTRRIATVFAEKVTSAARSVATTASVLVEYLTARQTYNMLLRGETDCFPLDLIADVDCRSGTSAAEGTSAGTNNGAQRSGILQPFLPCGDADPHASLIAFRWRAERPTTMVFPPSHSSEAGVVQWSIDARQNKHNVHDGTLFPYQRGATVDGEPSLSATMAVPEADVARLQQAVDFLITHLSRERPLVEACFIFRFVQEQLYFLYAPFVVRRGEMLERRLRFVVPKQFQHTAQFAVRGKGDNVGAEDLIETPRIDTSISVGRPSPPRRRVVPVRERWLDEQGRTAVQREQDRKAEAARRRALPKFSPCPDAPREHPETDKVARDHIQRRKDREVARAVLDALEGKKTMPIAAIAARLKLTKRQLSYLTDVRKEQEASDTHDVLASRAHSLEYARGALDGHSRKATATSKNINASTTAPRSTATAGPKVQARRVLPPLRLKQEPHGPPRLPGADSEPLAPTTEAFESGPRPSTTPRRDESHGTPLPTSSLRVADGTVPTVDECVADEPSSPRSLLEWCDARCTEYFSLDSSAVPAADRVHFLVFGMPRPQWLGERGQSRWEGLAPQAASVVSFLGSLTYAARSLGLTKKADRRTDAEAAEEVGVFGVPADVLHDMGPFADMACDFVRHLPGVASALCEWPLEEETSTQTCGSGVAMWQRAAAAALGIKSPAVVKDAFPHITELLFRPPGSAGPERPDSAAVEAHTLIGDVITTALDSVHSRPTSAAARHASVEDETASGLVGDIVGAALHETNSPRRAAATSFGSNSPVAAPAVLFAFMGPLPSAAAVDCLVSRFLIHSLRDHFVVLATGA